MISRIIFRTYKPKIHFKTGKKSTHRFVEEQPAEVVEHHKPQYLTLKKRLTDEEIDLLNQGGRAPSIAWKKITPITDIH